MQIPQVVSSNASFSPASIISAATVTYDPTSTSPHQNTANAELFYQLYKHKSNATAAERVREVERLGYKAIWLTVDASIPGNREKDVKTAFKGADPMSGDVVVDMGGTAGKMLINDDLDMSWEEVCDDTAR
jgi:L-lactate dehydrogenase (cytochrome)